MIYSMTGYAALTADLPAGALVLELRSVNHRYLEVQFRLADEFRSLEAAMRDAIARHIRRGKVDCRLQFQPRATELQLQAVDAALIGRLGEFDRLVRERLPDAEPLRVVDILRWPGIIAETRPDSEQLHKACLDTLERALTDLDASRSREGSKLKEFLLQRLADIETLVLRVAPQVPQLVATYRDKLLNAITEAGANPNEERLRQEVILFAQKIDVEEELSRLNTHLAEARRVLDSGGAAGKRLDFLMQEFNREANTLGSKAAANDISRAAIELKVLIEQMREQIQNIE